MSGMMDRKVAGKTLFDWLGFYCWVAAGVQVLAVALDAAFGQKLGLTFWDSFAAAWFAAAVRLGILFIRKADQ